jgi:hypothetical protein
MEYTGVLAGNDFLHFSPGFLSIHVQVLAFGQAGVRLAHQTLVFVKI